MTIIPTIRCSNMRKSLAFYTAVLDFEQVDGDDTLDDPSFSVLQRADGQIFLYRERALKTLGDPDNPHKVHEGPIDQTWGTREFYVDDPDGNTLRFTQVSSR